MSSTHDLAPLLKRLKLGAILNTLPERLALARREQLDYAAFLQIILADEVTRREQRRLEVPLQKAGFEEVCRLEDFRLERPSHPGPPPAGRCLLPGLPGPPRACVAGWPRRCREIVPGPGIGVCGSPCGPLGAVHPG